jgi:hypothetical protein
MRMSRTIAGNALLNKHTIKALPLAITTNTELNDSINGNNLRVLKTYAPAYDFITNIINNALETGKVGEYIKDAGEHYYEIIIKEQKWKDYFKHCGNKTIRQNLARQVLRELQTGWILLKGQDKRGRYVEERAPFRIMAKKYYEDGTAYREILMSKDVFEGLITGQCHKNGNDGFIEIPSYFYANITKTDKGNLQSYNSIYKLNIVGLMKNTHKKSEIHISREKFLEAIVPEYLDKDKNLKVNARGLHDSLVRPTKQICENIPEGMLVKNFFLGNKGDTSTIYFRR